MYSNRPRDCESNKEVPWMVCIESVRASDSSSKANTAVAFMKETAAIANPDELDRFTLTISISSASTTSGRESNHTTLSTSE